MNIYFTTISCFISLLWFSLSSQALDERALTPIEPVNMPSQASLKRIEDEPYARYREKAAFAFEGTYSDSAKRKMRRNYKGLRMATFDLFRAIAECSFAGVKQAIEAGADVNFITEAGNSALTQTARFKVNLNANADELLDWRIQKNFLELKMIIKILVEKGADTKHINDNGFTAAQLCSDRHNHRVGLIKQANNGLSPHFDELIEFLKSGKTCASDTAEDDDH